MNILILNGSPRANGSTAAMTQAFAEGAREAGHEVTVIPVGRKKIAGCLGCEYCHTKGNGRCIQKDDEEEVYEALEQAEMLVLASPVYYYTLSAQLQAAIHRTYAVKIPKRIRQTALLLSSGSPGVYEPAIKQYQFSIVDYYEVKDMGIMTVNEEDKRVEDNLEAIREFGRSM
ncbi:flavodoxin family protein [Clostridium transplantifaecale]|uniref:flavodoxin family protein n=1 Tax=Clostridium transplantifaecale TaxID=2479838 RepID=UPI000F63E578|nr:flavodoxin family protein [Clostridium transplantifaecale]